MKNTDGSTFRKKTLLILMMIGFIFFSAGFSMADTVTYTYTFEKPDVIVHADGKASIYLKGSAYSTSQVGAPILPVAVSRLFVPEGDNIEGVEVVYGEMVYLDGEYTVAHAISPRPLSQAGSYAEEPPDPQIYESSDQWPTEKMKRFSDQWLHGARIVTTSFYPVRYFPEKKTLCYATHVSVIVSTASQSQKTLSDARPMRALPKDMKRIKTAIDNGEAIDAYISGQPIIAPITDDAHQYLIITTEDLSDAFITLQTYRQSEDGGNFSVHIETVESIDAGQTGQDLPEKIRNFIIDSYLNHGTEFVVLGGDADGPLTSQAVPFRGCYATVSSTTDTNIPSDYYYACLDGDWNGNGNALWGEATDGIDGQDIDWMAEVAVGRIPADDTTEALTAIGKIIAYETDGDSPYRALLMGEQLDSNPTWGGNYMDYVYEGMGSIPIDMLYDRDLSSAWLYSDAIDSLSSNAYNAVFHLGHANVTYCLRLINAYLDSIDNTTLFFLYSQGCYANSIDNRNSSGSYGATDSIGEDFVVRNDSNAFSWIGNSRYGWYAPYYVQYASNLAHRKFADAIYQEDITQIGLANNRSKDNLDYSQGVYRWIAFEVNLMGDPATPLNTGCDPDMLTLSITTPAQGFQSRINESIQINANVANSCGESVLDAQVTATITNGEESDSVALLDDGNHDNGLAGDGNYGASWNPSVCGPTTILVTAEKTGCSSADDSVSGTVFEEGNATIAHWKMDEQSWDGSVDQVIDTGAGQNHGTAYGGATTVEGKFNNAGTFDGVNDKVQVPHSSEIEFGTGSFSICLWVKASSQQVWSSSTILDKDYSYHTSGLYRIALSDGYPRFQVQGSTSYEITAATRITDDSWYHIACVRDSEDLKIRIYVNGKEDATALDETVLQNTNSGFPLSFGSPTLPSPSQGDVLMYKGLIDDVRLYDIALSEDEILALFENRKNVLTWLPILLLN